MPKRPSALTESQSKVVCQNSHGAQNVHLLSSFSSSPVSLASTRVAEGIMGQR